MLLAQATAPSTAPSTESIGLFVLIAMMITRWLWEYTRNRRDEAERHEPRANPPLHKEYVSKAEHEKAVGDAKSELTKFRDETNAELKRGAARRAEIYDEQKAQGEQLARLSVETTQQSKDISLIKTDVAKIDDRIDALPQRIFTLLLDAQKVSGSKK